MIPEIESLISHFEHQVWNKEVQSAFMGILREEHFFNGKGEKDPSFSARDRINRAPKSLGFVSLSPDISLTSAGRALLHSRRKDEVFLRQMLKFQLPSPYHRLSAKSARFCVKPYLEMLRLIRVLGSLKFDELQVFGMQLTDWHKFDEIVEKIERFRVAKAENKGGYRSFKANYMRKELMKIYSERISSGAIKTRESKDATVDIFLRTQTRNMRDYADACMRYLSATGLVNVSHVGKSLSIIQERVRDVDYILSTVNRDPCFIDEPEEYLSYLGRADLPVLLTDNKPDLIERLRTDFPNASFDPKATTAELKDKLYDLVECRKEETLRKIVSEVKSYKYYDDVQNTFAQIVKGELLDAPLMLEWNTWRAMTMLDGGEIKANLHFDDYGNPMSTALGNMPDIVCDYGDFLLSVEVTMSRAIKQFETETEPVSRHLGKIKRESGKPCYCLFVAPSINPSCVAYFYGMHRLNIQYYGGKSIIVPLPLAVFRKMLEDSFKAECSPNPEKIRRFFERSDELIDECGNESVWFEEIKQSALNWLDL